MLRSGLGFVIKFEKRCVAKTLVKHPNVDRALSPRAYFSTSSPFAAASKEKEVKDRLRNVVEPITGRPLTSIGAIQGIRVTGDTVAIELDTMIAGYPHEEKVISDCKESLKGMPWASKVDVSLIKRRPVGAGKPNSTLSKVANIIAVSSCKGGVGKSTVAVNFACELRRRGLRVGLLDADIYGPSLPLMLGAVDLSVHLCPDNPKWILPLESDTGLKMISFGHVNPKSGAPGAGGVGAAVMRGPVATKVITQLVSNTNWGELDYLVIDMPPGTGDIQITLSQLVPLSGAVIVTTPHELALADAAKGVTMFEDLQIPTLAVVENMSYFRCEHGVKYYPFGRGGKENLIQAIANTSSAVYEGKPMDFTPILVQRIEECPLHCLPLSFESSALGQDGNSSGAGLALSDPRRRPVVVRDPACEASKIFREIADSAISELFKLQLTAQELPTISFVEGKGVSLRYFTPDRAIEYLIPPIELRVRDPGSGHLKPDHEANRIKLKDVFPMRFEQKGNYGVGIVWNDGHQGDIFKFEVLKDIANDLQTK